MPCIRQHGGRGLRLREIGRRNAQGDSAYARASHAEVPDREREVAHRTCLEAVAAVRNPRRHDTEPGWRGDAHVEVGSRRRGALGEDPRRRVRQPAATVVPGEQRQERPEPDAVAEPRDPIQMRTR
jgi:hypothetical protein